MNVPIALTPAQLSAAQSALPAWTTTATTLTRTFRFADFQSAMQFITDAVPEIERLNHHPDWRNVYNRVEVTLSTHDAGNRVTALDVELAKVLDWLFVTAT